MALLNKTTDKPVTINEGGTYERNSNKERVVAFHLDANGVVRFAPVGRGTEDRMELVDFLDQFTEVQDEQPKATVNNADGTEKK